MTFRGPFTRIRYNEQRDVVTSLSLLQDIVPHQSRTMLDEQDALFCGNS